MQRQFVTPIHLKGVLRSPQLLVRPVQGAHRLQRHINGGRIFDASAAHLPLGEHVRVPWGTLAEPFARESAAICAVAVLEELQPTALVDVAKGLAIAGPQKGPADVLPAIGHG